MDWALAAQTRRTRANEPDQSRSTLFRLAVEPFRVDAFHGGGDLGPKQVALAVVDLLSDVVLPLGLGHVVGHLDRPLSPLPDGLILFDDVAHHLTLLAGYGSISGTA